MGRVHTYANTAAAVAVQMDRALTARPGEPHRLAAESEIAFTAHRLGCVPTKAAPTPLDCDLSFAYEAGALQWGHFVESWLIVLQEAGLRTGAARGGRGSGWPLDGKLDAWRPPSLSDGGGPAVWQLRLPNGDRIAYSKRLAALGVTRLIDVYGGHESPGAASWATWEQVEQRLLIGTATPLDKWIKLVSDDYRRLITELRRIGEARRWLVWFHGLQGDAPVRESPAVERRLRAVQAGSPIKTVLDAKESGLEGDTDPEYLVEWQGFDDESEREWVSSATVEHHWGLHEWLGSEPDRRAAAREAMDSVRARRGVAHFLFADEAVRVLGERTSRALFEGDDKRLHGRDTDVLRLVETLQTWAARVSQPARAADNLKDDRAAERELRWEVAEEQTFFGGQLRSDAAGDGALHDGVAPGVRDALAAAVADDDGEEDSVGAMPESGGASGFLPEDAREAWHEDPEATRGRVPSLAPGSASEIDWAEHERGRARLLDVRDLRHALRGDSVASLWVWRSEEERQGHRRVALQAVKHPA